ncbi:MAG TPA: hypothetical protein VN864_07150 [Thermoplasmata archaeon]|nr:hypothetical protein [Thermoplasmata archaeon]
MPALFVLNLDLAAYVFVALGMVAAEVFILTQIVPRSGPLPPLTRMVIGSSALLGSSGVLMAALAAFAQPDLNTYTVVLMTFNSMMLVPPGLWFISLIVFEDRRIRRTRWFWPVAITAMATSAEVLMGLFFTVAGGSPPGFLPVLAGTLTSAWFLWSMAAAMVALLLWIPMARGVRDPLLGLAAAGIVAPFVPVDPPVGAGLMGAVMALTVIGALQLLRTGRGAGLDRVLTPVVGAFLAMSLTGVALAVAPDLLAPTLAFGGVMAVTMTGEFLFLVREGLVRLDGHPATESVSPTSLGVASGTARPTAPARP